MTILLGMDRPVANPNPSVSQVQDSRFKSFEEFWPFYLGEHTCRMCRFVHYVGTVGALVAIALAVAVTPLWFAAAPVLGYGAAWIAHFVIEKNRPATWSYVWWSFLADGRMFRMAVSGRLRGEFSRHGVPFDGPIQR